MKTSVITALLTAATLAAGAQTVSVPGGLRTTLIDAGISTGKLVLAGSADVRDLEYLATLPLDTLDMRSLKITGLSMTTSGYGGRNVFDPDVLPPYIFYGSPAKTVYLPETLRVIEAGAFISSGVVSVILPQGLEKIGDYAFRGCLSLKEINFPDRLSEMGVGAFSGCSELRVADMSKTRLSSVPTQAFADATYLATVMLPESVSGIGTLAFAGTAVYQLAAARPVNADDFALSMMRRLESSSVQVNNTPAGIYYGDVSLLNVAKPLAPIPALGYGECGWLPTERITEGVGEIGDYAFYRLKEAVVTLCEGVTAIGKGAFDNISDLVGIDCSRLGADIPYVTQETFAGVNKKRVRVKVKGDDDDFIIKLWKQAPYWSEFEIVTEFSGVQETAISGYNVGYSDGIVDVTASEVLNSVTVADISGRILARADNLGTTSVSLSVGEPATPVLIVTSITDSASRCDKLLLK